MQNNTFLFLTFGLSLLFISCSPTLYVTDTKNVPLLSEKGEYNSSLNFGSSLEDEIQVQASYAFTDNIGGMANYYYGRESSVGSGVGKFYELGAGYFYSPFEKYKNIIFETYGLLGVGNVKNVFIDDNDVSSGIHANVLRLGIQPSIGYKHKNFAMALTTKISLMNYFNVYGDLVYNDLDYNQFLKKHPSHLFFEPALTLRAGLANVQIQTQLGFGFLLNNSRLPYEEMNLSFGVAIKLHNK